MSEDRSERQRARTGTNGSDERSREEPLDMSEARSLLRVCLGLTGAALACYGIVRILQQPSSHPVKLAEWLLGALLVHDALLAPVVLLIGATVSRFVPAGPRPYLQGGLIAAGLVSVPGVLLINRQGKVSSPSLALLQQNYLANLAILLAGITAISAASYGVAVLRAKRLLRSGRVLRSSRRKFRSPADQ
jgi:hypothetical protein